MRRGLRFGFMAKEFREVRDPNGINTDDAVSSGIAKPIQTVEEFKRCLMSLSPEELGQLMGLMAAEGNSRLRE